MLIADLFRQSFGEAENETRLRQSFAEAKAERVGFEPTDPFQGRHVSTVLH